jgi:hypothetical protein
MGKFLRLVNGVPRSLDEAASSPIYDERIVIASNIAAGTNVTLPLSGTYDGQELEVYFRGQVLDDVLDYNFVGSPPRTQVQFTFDLVPGDTIRFRKVRGA